jgi:tetratricopeptide (TPR) repeat protein
MPKSARVLHFPVRPAVAVYTVEAARTIANAFISEPHATRSATTWEFLFNADVTVAILDALKKIANAKPEYCFGEAAAAYERISASPLLGVFDERDYFLGEVALLAGNTARLSGRYDVAEFWLDLADSAFRHTVNSAPLLVRVNHARLAIKYDMHRYREVLALLPNVVREYERLEMVSDVAKARFLEALTLKELGETEQAFSALLALRSAFTSEPTYRSLVLAHIAEEYGRREDPEQALSAYQEALEVAKHTGNTLASIQLKAAIGDAYRAKGSYAEAVTFFRAATLEASEAGMHSRLAYLRVILAEALLAAGRSREAEWEVLAALPIIEQQQMVAEGITAIAVLRESVNHRRIDASALAELRKRLQAS